MVCLLEPIGEITANFSALEKEMKDSLGFLLFLGCDNYVRLTTIDLLTAQLSFRQIVDLVQSFFAYRFDSEHASFKFETDDLSLQEICKKMYKVEQDRNTITHSNWEWERDGNSRKHFRTKSTARAKGYKRQEEEMTKEKLISIANEIGEVTNQLCIFFETLEKEFNSVKPQESLYI